MKRWSWAVLGAALAVSACGMAIAAESADRPLPPPSKLGHPIVGYANGVAISERLDVLAANPDRDAVHTTNPREVLNPRVRPGEKNLPPVRQSLGGFSLGDAAVAAWIPQPYVMSPPIVTFEGMNNGVNDSIGGGQVYPPDTNGAIGPLHYVQTVNSAVQVFGRDGSVMTAPFLMSRLFGALGASDPCATTDDGDPIVVYDHLADRWLLSQFGVEAVPLRQCIAVSQTGDPTGAYYVYSFTMPNDKFNDYPHFGLWPDGYYMTDNQFNLAGTAFLGAGAFAFDRAKMLVGDPDASYIYFDLFDFPTPGAGANIGGVLAASLDGQPPAAGTREVFMYFTATEFGDAQDGMRMFEFHPDFATPASSTLVELPALAVAAFDPTTANSRNIVPQPAPAAAGNYLDAITDRLMHRLQYRSLAGHDSLVVTHNVNLSPTPATTFHGGVRYYEFRKITPGPNPWAVNEQATFAPDADNRWMGSAAMDKDGDLAVGYTVSSATVFPSLRYAGRLAADLPGGLPQGEAVMQAGSFVQTGTAGRWGDYSALQIDPNDGCTFWYTNEYYSTPQPAACGGSTVCWQTRVGSFKFPGCSAAAAAGFIQGRVTATPSGNAVPNALVSAGNGYLATTDIAGNYRLHIPAGAYSMTVTRSGIANGTAAGVVVLSGAGTQKDFALAGAPALGVTAKTFVDDAAGDINNGNIDAGECVAVKVQLTNSGFGGATGIGGVLSTATPGVSISPAQQSSTYPNLAPNASSFNGSNYVIRTSSLFALGTPIALNFNVASDQGPVSANFSFPSGTLNPATSTFLNSGAAVPIPDDDPAGAVMPIPVAGFASTVSKVRVSVYLTHTYDSDLAISLIAPDSTEVVLASGVGGSGNNFGTSCPAISGGTTFDDAAAVSINGGSAPFTGSYQPAEALSTLNGKVANGAWQLKVVDSAAIDTGSIQCVALQINGFITTVGTCAGTADLIFADGFGN
jgi:subtilisin-like proprotein convertase family protein